MEINKKLKIHLVDDDAFYRNIFKQYLANLSYTDVQDFENGEDCVNALVLQPDVIFLDHNMENMKGTEVLKKIKRFNPDIFVVFVSAQEDIETAVSALKYGAFDYIVKGDDEVHNIIKVLNKIHQVKELMKKQSRGIIHKILSYL